MCTICAAMRPFDPSCTLDGLAGTDITSLRAVIREVGDAPAGPSSGYRMAPGDGFRGVIGQPGDRDWIGIRLEAGRSYVFELNGDSLGDPLLRLLDGQGRQLSLNDDGGVGLNSRITFTATTTGLHFLSAEAYGSGTGSYQLTAQGGSGPAPAQPASIATMADYLTRGYWADQFQSPRSFDTSFGNVITVDLSGLSDQGRALARNAMEAWSAVADIRFRDDYLNPQIVFTENSGAWSSSTTLGGRLVSAVVNVGSGWLSDHGGRVGTYGFQTYLHEIGHALGLGHMGNYNGSGTFAGNARFLNDSWQASVMSYFSQSENPNIRASHAVAVTLMPADIMAIQALYGAPGAGSLTAGDTIYGLGHSLGNTWLGRVFDAQVGPGQGNVHNPRAVTMTLWDAGGFDIVNLSHDSQAQRVDLRMGAGSDVFGLRGNLQIAQGTLIEGFLAGSGNDTVTGNVAANLLRGGAGDDLIEGLAGNDSLHGGDGRDTLIGGAGDDWLWGNQGDDRLVDMQGNNRMWGGFGDDTLIAGGGRDTLRGEAGHDSLSGGGGNDELHGGAGRDTLLGGAGDDWLAGGPDDDLLQGGPGRDTLLGGAGDDRLLGGDGDDTLAGGTGRDWLEGGMGADLLRGEQGDDRLFGQQGNDTLVGGMGADTMTGGMGADMFRFLGAGDSRPDAPDLITDFRPGEDLLDFRAMSLAFVGTGPLAGARSLRWDHVGQETVIEVDVTGDQRPDMMIRLSGRLDLDVDHFLF